MAEAWYLMKSPHSQVSGFESEAFDDFAEEGFLEALQSGMGVDVELYNYDLSECKKLRAIIEGNLQDTKLKALSRQILLPIGTCKAGMYIKYKNRYWLIEGIVDDNKVYEKGVMVICNYLLSWMNDEGKVLQRWANVESASQYNNGETGIRYYSIRTDQLIISLPDDEDSLLLKTGDRFIIDRRCPIYEKRFAKDVIKDTSNPVIVYKLTRSDSVLYNYSDSGHQQLIVYQDEQREDDGYYVIDGKGYWLCKPIQEKEQKPSSCFIEYDTIEIYNGLEPCQFSARFYDESGNEVVSTPQWEIRCDFIDSLDIEYVDNVILISVNDDTLINKSFELFLNADGFTPASVNVTIKAFF